jgi:predicted Holliday junction resolvase-like endonuclease
LYLHFLIFVGLIIAVLVLKNYLLFFLIVLLVSPVYSADNTDTILSKLNDALRNKEHYVRLKEERILNFKKIKSDDLNKEQEYNYNKTLYTEYQKFNSDSAIFYVKKNLNIASELQNAALLNLANLQLATLYSSSGKYRESEALLKSIDKKTLSRSLLQNYYVAYREFFEHYAANSYDVKYIQQIRKYRDSLLTVLEPNTLNYQVTKIQQIMSQKKLAIAEKQLLHLFKNIKEDNSQYAMITYLLGSIYEETHQLEPRKKYYALSATSDLKNANKDNASLQELAQIFYEIGDVDMAYKLTQSAVEDALYCNVQFRTLLMSQVYSIINTVYLEREAQRKTDLQLYLLCISLLSAFLIVAIIYVYKQMKKVSRIRGELYETSQKLAELNKDITETNNQLQERNAQLSESNHIKEEYIAHFFSLCSTYINKLENYRIILNKKANAKQFDEIFKMLKSTTLVDNELEELYKNFDIIFLNLYPTFVKDFNALLINEEQIVLKQGELLNTELRIFALIRLGINDSVKIAAFLRYSLSTIYNYRTRARNKAAVSRNDFEEIVMKIGLISSKV